MTRHRLAAQQRPYDDCNYGHDDELERIDPPGNDGNTADGQQQVARSEGNRHPGFLDEEKAADDGGQSQPFKTLDPGGGVHLLEPRRCGRVTGHQPRLHHRPLCPRLVFIDTAQDGPHRHLSDLPAWLVDRR